jgi:hypothetical protein
MADRSLFRGVPLLAGCLVSFVAAGQSPAPAAPSLVPLDYFKVPEGLEVTVWARSPQLRNPTNMDIDAQGRIWVT